MYERVLFPTDGSEGSDVALEHALELAHRFDAPLHVLYVVDVRALQGSDAYSGPALDSLVNAGEERVERVVERAAQSGVEVTNAVVEGTPATSIIEESRPGDLIVMGTHGRSGLDRYLIGSTTEKVVRTAEVPVVTVPMTD